MDSSAVVLSFGVIEFIILSIGVFLLRHVFLPKNKKSYESDFADLVELPDYEEVYYSVNTHTVYYVIDFGDVSTMTPYISNGCYCKYENGRIVEVIPRIKIDNYTN